MPSITITGALNNASEANAPKRTTPSVQCKVRPTRMFVTIDAEATAAKAFGKPRSFIYRNTLTERLGVDRYRFIKRFRSTKATTVSGVAAATIAAAQFLQNDFCGQIAKTCAQFLKFFEQGPS